MQSTLVLNGGPDHEPLSIVSAQRAITLIVAGRAVSVDNSTRTMRSRNQVFLIPYVISLTEMVPHAKRSESVFSRRGVLVRDGFKCVYCGNYGTTIDHVIPQSKGGPTSYENCVAACSKCNSEKDDLSLEEIGWSLPKPPEIPSWYLLALHKSPVGSDQRRSWKHHISQFYPAVLEAV
jgi:5-methylcytosine-specific restriction endonuclease McrA